MGTLRQAPPPAFDLKKELARLPNKPGVYRMFNGENQLIYVGKAKNLKNRVRSYFQQQNQHSLRIYTMVSQIQWFDTIVTDTEVDALMLESNLIKQHKPKYNILLRDDKKYPWIGLSDDPFPRLFVTRNPKRHGKTQAKYFGPYTATGDMHTFLRLIRKHFPLRQRRTPLFKDRPCLNYSIGICPGPCQNLVSSEAYGETLRQVELFLKGKTDELLSFLEREMAVASENLNFEHAAALRDRYRAVACVSTRQKMVTQDGSVNQDIVGSAHDGQRFLLTVLSVRQGKLIRSRHVEIKLTHHTTPEEAYPSALQQFYGAQDIGMMADDLPDEIVVQHRPDDLDFLSAWLNQQRRRGKKASKTIEIIHPKRGFRKDFLEMAMKNAAEALDRAQLYDAELTRHDPVRGLLELQEALNLPDFPRRMECYDISHFQGAETVASMVVFTEGVPDKQAYRRFKIRTAEGKPDDFASMAEVMTRRFKANRKTAGWEDPDLVIIDGGKGQLSAALGALQSQQVVEQSIISLAKRYEEVFLPNQSHPVILPRQSPALYLLQQIRDEAHRFAITYHRQRRGKSATRSVLDSVPGIGPKRKQRLMERFGNVSHLLKADSSVVAETLGLSLPRTENLLKALRIELNRKET